jgi:hypothetical protein
VVSTLWDGADQPIAQGVADFYRSLGKGGTNGKSEALCNAQLYLLRLVDRSSARGHAVRQVGFSRRPRAFGPVTSRWANRHESHPAFLFATPHSYSVLAVWRVYQVEVKNLVRRPSAWKEKDMKPISRASGNTQNVSVVATTRFRAVLSLHRQPSPACEISLALYCIFEVGRVLYSNDRSPFAHGANG